MHQRLTLAFLSIWLGACVALPAESMAYGAIATSSDSLSDGTSSGHATAGKAQAAALNSCREGGKHTCRVVATFQHQCFATASGSSTTPPYAPVSWAVAGNQSSASRQALANCRRRESGCRVVGTGCDH
jgi:hypothetical protein